MNWPSLTAAVFLWNARESSWQRADFVLPERGCLVDASGNDLGLRVVDLDGDSDDDLVFSNDCEYWVRLLKARLLAGQER